MIERASTSRAVSITDPPRVSADRLLGVLLILVQLVVLGGLSGAHGFSISMSLLTLYGLWTRVRLNIEPIPRNLIYALMTIGFLLHYMFAPYPLPAGSEFIRSSLAHSLARLLIAAQVLQLYLQHESGRLPFWLAACGAVALALATNLQMPETVHLYLLWIITAFIAVFALYCSRARRSVDTAPGPGSARWLLLTTALLLTVLLSAGSSWALLRHERSIEWFLTEYLGYSTRTTRAGFNPTGRLEAVSAWRVDGAETVMLRIFAEEEPGYLRGVVFDRYQGSSRDTSYTPWASTSTYRAVDRIPAPQGEGSLRPGDATFRVAAGDATRARVLDIWPEEHGEPQLFTPLGTRTVSVRDDDVHANAHRVIKLTSHPLPVPYTVRANRSNSVGADCAIQAPTEIDRDTLTSLGVPVDEAVQQLATELFADCRTAGEKIAAVQRYFQENYEYKLGISVPYRMDPVTYFLTEQPAAHCEYFATGTAVLLRLGQVPCRYVVGFVASERNDVGGFWVARQRDAHAWVEAYDEDAKKWVLVESTPAAGIPQPREQSYAAQLADSFRHRLSIWRMTLREYGIMTIWLSVIRVVWSIPGLITLLSVLAVLLVRNRPQLKLRVRRERTPDHLREMRRVLARLDRQARRHGFERAADETLARFAQRLRDSDSDSPWSRTTAECYWLYADLRYRGQTGPAAIRRLQQATAGIAHVAGPATTPPRQSG